MPINPNIALGAQPQQQPNMLGQLGQMMAIKAAQQEMEGSEGVRNALSRGAPEDPTQLLQYGKQGRATYESLLKGKKEQLESAEKRLTMTGQIAGYVRDNPTPENFITAVSTMKQNGLLTQAQADRVIADAGDDPTKIKSYAERAASDALKEADRLTARTRIQAANIGAAPGHRQADIAGRRLSIEEQDRAEVAALMRGEAPSAAPAMTAPVGAGGVPTGVSAPTNALAPASAAAPTNALVTPNAAPTGDVFDQINSIDAQIAQLMRTGNPKATAIAQVLNSQRTQLLASAKQQYGGPLVPMEVTDPDTGQRTVVQGRPDQYGRLVPVEMGAVPLSTNASATGGTGISPTVARPAPTASVLKERQAAERLPEAIAMNNDAIRKIDEMIGGVDAKGNPLPGAKGKPHPGFTGAVGFGLGAQYIPGTDARGFKARHEEVLGQAFLDAFEALKGGGAITEIEGQKATAARTRMNLATSEKEYMDAAREYQGVLKRGIENARSRIQRSGGTPPPSSGTPSSIDALLDKYK
jgi:hypothetical protein